MSDRRETMKHLKQLSLLAAAIVVLILPVGFDAASYLFSGFVAQTDLSLVLAATAIALTIAFQTLVASTIATPRNRRLLRQLRIVGSDDDATEDPDRRGISTHSCQEKLRLA
jgi:hypothetical protein